MLDVDHVEDPRAWFQTLNTQVLSDNRIYLVAITASGHGLRIIGERMSYSVSGLTAERSNSDNGLTGAAGLESIEQAQMRIPGTFN